MSRGVRKVAGIVFVLAFGQACSAVDSTVTSLSSTSPSTSYTSPQNASWSPFSGSSGAPATSSNGQHLLYGSFDESTAPRVSGNQSGDYQMSSSGTHILISSPVVIDNINNSGAIP